MQSPYKRKEISSGWESERSHNLRTTWVWGLKAAAQERGWGEWALGSRGLCVTENRVSRWGYGPVLVSGIGVETLQVKLKFCPVHTQWRRLGKNSILVDKLDYLAWSSNQGEKKSFFSYHVLWTKIRKAMTRV